MAEETKTIQVTNQIKVESILPLLAVHSFQLEWGTNEHAFLWLEGYADGQKQLQLPGNSKIRIWLENDTTLFYGYLTKIRMDNAGETTRIRLEARSGSFKLDQKPESASFQDVGETYARTVQKAAERAGGRVICTEGKDRTLGKPPIQYEETAWEFCRRLASRLGTYIIPDIATGREAFWFGMRKGNRVPAFSEEEYAVEVQGMTSQGRSRTGYEVESREFYRIGDHTVFGGREMTIFKVQAHFRNGELTFGYLLREEDTVNPIYQNRFTGLGLKGTVVETKQEQVRIALDIDGGESTGEYFYAWHPETGNALYAVPETGMRIVLYFGSPDEREGFVMHSLPNAVDERNYKDRYFNTKEGNSMYLSEGSISFSRGGRHRVSLADGALSIRSSGKMDILARDTVKMSAGRIAVSTPDELNICQGEV